MTELVSLFDNGWVHRILLLSARISALFLMTPVLYALPIPGVIRVLVSDLTSEGLVRVNLPLDPNADGAVDRVLLERVLAGLEAL